MHACIHVYYFRSFFTLSMFFLPSLMISKYNTCVCMHVGEWGDGVRECVGVCVWVWGGGETGVGMWPCGMCGKHGI